MKIYAPNGQRPPGGAAKSQKHSGIFALYSNNELSKNQEAVSKKLLKLLGRHRSTEFATFIVQMRFLFSQIMT